MNDISQIPEDVKNVLREEFDKDPKICQMRIQVQTAQQRGDYASALLLNKEIERLYGEVLYNYLTNINKTDVKDKLSNLGLPNEAIKEVMIYVLTAFMSMDILNSCILDANDVIHRTNKDWSLEMFDEIKKLCTLVRAKMQNLYVNTRYLDDDIWGDIVDDMYKMAHNKAQSIFNKMDKKYGVEIVKPIDCQPSASEAYGILLSPEESQMSESANTQGKLPERRQKKAQSSSIPRKRF